jgi:hypothetical protein
VLGGDPSLNRIRTDDAGEGVDHAQPLLDLGPIPKRAVLILQQHHLTGVIQARLTPRMLEQHQRQQRPRLRVAGEGLDQHSRQPNRLVGEFVADQGLGAGGEVALVEDQIESRQHRGEALRQLLSRGDFVWDPGVADLGLGPDQTLGHGRLLGEEGAGDLRGGEAAESPQGEGNPRLRPERRVAAGEDQPKPVVGHLVIGLRLLGVDLLGPGGKSLQALEHLLLHLKRPLAPQPVDRLVAADPGDPGARVVRDAVCRPALERDDERLLDRLLGEVEVAEDPDQARDRPSRLVPEQAVDELIRSTRNYDAVASAFSGSS